MRATRTSGVRRTAGVAGEQDAREVPSRRRGRSWRTAAEAVRRGRSARSPAASRARGSAVARAIDEAILGDPVAESPEAQPDRLLTPADFPSLYLRHRSSLEAHARRFLADPHDVEDVVQETFLRLFLAIDEIETEPRRSRSPDG